MHQNAASMIASIRPAVPDDAAAWLQLRCQLWPDSEDAHRKDIAAFFAGTAREPTGVLVAEKQGRLIGMAELSIRAYAVGCTTDQVAFLEGWFVLPAERRRGVGRALVRAAEAWGRDAGCREFASDTQPDNPGSIEAHLAAGFEEAGMMVCFRKRI